jgi:IMP cyclohydrolase
MKKYAEGLGMRRIEDYLEGNAYPGRGIILGCHADGKTAVAAYFIMGRSENSRNRVFVEDGTDIRTKAFDESKLRAPSLVIYNAARSFVPYLIVTNGDQTDTVYAALAQGEDVRTALRTRAYEPDPPLYTPRISGVIHFFGAGRFAYLLNILKAGAVPRDADPVCLRNYFEFSDPVPGYGHFIHTYQKDGDPPPSFAGEPVAVALCGDLEALAQKIWTALDSQNRVSLFVRYIDTETGAVQTKIINKNN